VVYMVELVVGLAERAVIVHQKTSDLRKPDLTAHRHSRPRSKRSAVDVVPVGSAADNSNNLGWVALDSILVATGAAEDDSGTLVGEAAGCAELTSAFAGCSYHCFASDQTCFMYILHI
jgi:hypothetical protein